MPKLKNKNLFLVGPMGAGKSSVGKYLAKILHKDFFDTDEEIEKRTGVELGWIFEKEGEHGFRKRETQVLTELVKRHNIVLATGGGTIVEEENRRLLQENGSIIYLEVSLDYQQGRVVNESRRPLLQVKNKDEVLVQLSIEREPFYQELAELTVLTDNRSVRSVSDDILGWIIAV